MSVKSPRRKVNDDVLKQDITESMEGLTRTEIGSSCVPGFFLWPLNAHLRLMGMVLYLVIMGCAKGRLDVEQLVSDPGKAELEVSSSNRSYHFRCIVPESVLVTTPRWEAGQPNPPLQMQRAIEAAELVRSKLDDQGYTWAKSFEEASLVPFDRNRGVWVWVISYGWKYSDKLNVVVLMDGQALEPEVSENHYEGIPVRYAPSPEPVPGKTSLEMVEEFVAHIHDDRRFLGQIIHIGGIVERVPFDDPEAVRLQKWYRVKLGNGLSLICAPPGGLVESDEPHRVFYKAQLVGFKDQTITSKDFDKERLTAGIRILGPSLSGLE